MENLCFKLGLELLNPKTTQHHHIRSPKTAKYCSNIFYVISMFSEVIFECNFYNSVIVRNEDKIPENRMEILQLV